MTAPITDHDWWFAAGVPTHTLVVEVPTAVVLNSNQRIHHHPKAERTATIRQLAGLRARSANPIPRLDRCELEVCVGWPNRSRKRDAPNLWPTMKAAIDGIVDAGWLPDDNDEHIVEYHMSSYYCGRKGLVVLHFSFLDLSTQETA